MGRAEPFPRPSPPRPASPGAVCRVRQPSGSRHDFCLHLHNALHADGDCRATNGTEEASVVWTGGRSTAPTPALIRAWLCCEYKNEPILCIVAQGCTGLCVAAQAHSDTTVPAAASKPRWMNERTWWKRRTASAFPAGSCCSSPDLGLPPRAIKNNPDICPCKNMKYRSEATNAFNMEELRQSVNLHRHDVLIASQCQRRFLLFRSFRRKERLFL